MLCLQLDLHQSTRLRCPWKAELANLDPISNLLTYDDHQRHPMSRQEKVSGRKEVFIQHQSLSSIWASTVLSARIYGLAVPWLATAVLLHSHRRFCLLKPSSEHSDAQLDSVHIYLAERVQFVLGKCLVIFGHRLVDTFRNIFVYSLLLAASKRKSGLCLHHNHLAGFDRLLHGLYRTEKAHLTLE